MSHFVYCSIPQEQYAVVRTALDELAIICGGEVVGWGGGDEWMYDRDFAFETKAQALKFQSQIRDNWPNVEFYVSD